MMLVNVTLSVYPHRGGGGAPAPPSLLGKQSQSGNIRSTVGQYWLSIKKMGPILSILWKIS